MRKMKRTDGGKRRNEGQLWFHGRTSSRRSLATVHKLLMQKTTERAKKCRRIRMGHGEGGRRGTEKVMKPKEDGGGHEGQLWFHGRTSSRRSLATACKLSRIIRIGYGQEGEIEHEEDEENRRRKEEE
mmetsp:Transcript_52694/g.163499  ORF Transcript_52694/g.163499 Transcript_52694/m.163499 type:complete len:128 (-) Transcript_52694:128-511(-)